MIHSAKKISEQRKWVRGCTNVKIGHERPKTLGWGVYTRVLLDRPEYKRHNGPLDFLFGQALFMGLLKNRLDQIAQVSKHVWVGVWVAGSMILGVVVRLFSVTDFG